MPRNTLIDYFDDLARAEGQFLVYDAGFRARSHSYVEVGRAARGIASRLAGAGVRKGDQVVFWSENRPERIVAFWSCLLGGVIVVPIDYRASPALLARIATRVMARLILVGEDVPPVPEAVAVSVWRLHELQWRDGKPQPTAIGGDDVAEIIFTAGAAPHDAELEAFWSARGFAVIRGYGLTETAPIVSVTHPFHIQAGSVGKAIPGVDVEIAPDGEILVLDHGVDPDAVVRDANARLEAHQNIRRAQVWPEAVLPRTEGTGKLRRATIREWVRTGAAPTADKLAALVGKYAGRGDLSPPTTIDELGFSSLERVELMVALEDTFQTRLDEKAFAGAHDVGQLRALVEEAFRGTAAPVEPLEFPAWNRSLPARLARRVALSGFILPLARVLAWVHVVGRQHLAGLEGPVIFASNPRHRDDRVAAGRAGRARAAGGSRPSVPSHVARGATRTASSGSPLRTSARRYRHSSDACTGAAGATSRSTGHQYGHVRQTLDQRERSGLGLVCSSTRVARRRTTAATRERAWAFPIGRSGRHEQLPCTAPSSGSARIMLEIGPRTKRSPAENSTSSSGKFRKPSRI